MSILFGLCWGHVGPCGGHVERYGGHVERCGGDVGRVRRYVEAVWKPRGSYVYHRVSCTPPMGHFGDPLGYPEPSKKLVSGVIYIIYNN